MRLHCGGRSVQCVHSDAKSISHGPAGQEGRLKCVLTVAELLRRIVRLAREQLAPDANVQHPNMLTGPTASRGLRKPAPPSDRHLEKEQPRRGQGAAAKPGLQLVACSTGMWCTSSRSHRNCTDFSMAIVAMLIHRAARWWPPNSDSSTD